MNTGVFGDFLRVEKTYLSVSDWDLVYCDAFIQIIDWIYIMSKGKEKDPTGARTLPRIYFRIQVQRLARPILVRVVFWMFLLGLLSFGTFAIDPDDVGDRLQYATTMVLAIVAFQFVTASIIPSVPYLTMIDKYNLLVLVFIILITMESIVVGWYYISNPDSFVNNILTDNTIVDIDQVTFWLFIIMYGVAHGWFIWESIKASRYEKTKIGKSKAQLDSMFAQDGYRSAADDEGPVQIMTYTREEFYAAHQ